MMTEHHEFEFHRGGKLSFVSVELERNCVAECDEVVTIHVHWEKSSSKIDEKVPE